MQKRLAEATWYLDASIMRMRADAIELGQMAEAYKAAPMELRARMRWNLNRGCELVGQAVAELFHAATGRAVFLDHPLQQRFQDLQAAMAHAYLTPDQVARAVGGSLLGTSKPEIIL
jgi:3-hydroxy-9,10-secoandrosta-1,3,5(10)-triene-9,17-dione monooxygenase